MQWDGRIGIELDAQRGRELFCYLLLNRDRPHTREKLANLLWESSSPNQAKQYLRQTLWQLQSALDCENNSMNSLLSIESVWIRVNPTADLWLDVDKLERAFSLCLGMRGRELNPRIKNLVEKTVQLYKGDLLENWYQDWCIFERERFQNIYLILLDKLMEYYEWHQEFDRSITYGAQILRCDMAHERTFRRLMRLYYLSGDRTNALRQFDLCVKYLEKELGVKPTSQTVSLYKQIKDDLLSPSLLSEINEQRTPQVGKSLSALLYSLNHVRNTLMDAQNQVESDIEVINSALDDRG